MFGIAVEVDMDQAAASQKKEEHKQAARQRVLTAALRGSAGDSDEVPVGQFRDPAEGMKKGGVKKK